jgi:predicted nucleic acid-binding protein
VIVYLDSSALVKRYVAERSSAEVNALIAGAAVVGTAVVSRAELAAALAKAVRVGTLPREQALAGLQAFRAEWVDLVRLPATEGALALADRLAWELGLRGYDAVHLAAASLWRDALGEPVVLATFDLQLWAAAPAVGLTAWPEG